MKITLYITDGWWFICLINGGVVYGLFNFNYSL